jgi:hypothetical protein
MDLQLQNDNGDLFDLWTAQVDRRCLKHAVGPDRHLRAQCPSCGVLEILPAMNWLRLREGEMGLDALGGRMRCLCGARSTQLEIWRGAEPPRPAEAKPQIWRFV